MKPESKTSDAKVDRTSGTATASVDGAGGARWVRHVRVVHGEALGADVVVLDRDEVLVGRDEGDCRIALQDSRVSRNHLRIALDATSGRWVAEDLGSHNGTFVDGERIKRAPLADGAVLRVGRCLLLFVETELFATDQLEPEAPPMFGPSFAMQRLRGEVRLVAKQALTVLILGETGAGKELVAQEIHAWSGRTGPFVPVNCAAIPPGLAESELFGHEAGAFTGAAKRAPGLFASANGGTLFLDEIGELPPSLQPKLLRALALGETRAVGAPAARRDDVRVVAATHRDLSRDRRAGAFRGDLLARLSGWTVRVPELRKRREDILPLALRFLAAREPGAVALSHKAAEALLLYSWPHNVRELEHAMASAAIRRAGTGLVLREHLPASITERAPASIARGRRARTVEAKAGPVEQAVVSPPRGKPTRDDLRHALERCAGNIAKVAAMFGKDRHQIYRWARRFGLDVESYRPDSGSR